ncbi:hypothetical protein VTK56DRAFT_176 [Thermocarpiscus australiensis]
MPVLLLEFSDRTQIAGNAPTCRHSLFFSILPFLIDSRCEISTEYVLTLEASYRLGQEEMLPPGDGHTNEQYGHARCASFSHCEETRSKQRLCRQVQLHLSP